MKRMLLSVLMAGCVLLPGAAQACDETKAVEELVSMVPAPKTISQVEKQLLVLDSKVLWRRIVALKIRQAVLVSAENTMELDKLERKCNEAISELNDVMRGLNRIEESEKAAAAAKKQ